MQLRAVPFSEDILDVVAADVVQAHPQSDLADVVILLANVIPAPKLREKITLNANAQGTTALLGPRILPLRDHVAALQAHVAAERDDEITTPTESARLLSLFDVIRRYSEWQLADPWTLSKQLLKLFDALTLNEVNVNDAAALRDEFVEAYQAPSDLAMLSKEASIVATLWEAWRAYHHNNGWTDTASDYVQGLQRLTTQAQPIYVVGYDELQRCEARALRQAGAYFYFYGGLQPAAQDNPSGDGSLRADLVMTRVAQQLGCTADQALPVISAETPREQVLETVYAPHRQGSCDADAEIPTLRQRAEALQQRFPVSPLANSASGQLRVAPAADRENEAQAIALQIRRWRQQGIGEIGIISEDRSLSRRLRALLERAGISLRDYGGWALSTTSAATVVERWLQTVETNFAPTPFLDVLHSSLLGASAAELALWKKFESALIEAGHLNDMAYYQTRLQVLDHRPAGWEATDKDDIAALLQRYQRIASPLMVLATTEQPAYAKDYAQALLSSVQQLGLWAGLEHDLAGQAVVVALDALYIAAEDDNVEMSWDEFRSWLHYHLENEPFLPPHATTAVSILTLSQSRLLRFEALVIAGATQGAIPSINAGLPMFNDAVRANLGLPTTRADLERQLYLFRGALAAAPKVLITYAQEKEGEEQLPSPWVELLMQLHHLAYENNLSDHELARAADVLAHVVANREAGEATPTLPPTPRLPAERVPVEFTASQHQALIECPYQWYGRYVIKAGRARERSSIINSAIFGEIVHLCVERFLKDYGPEDLVFSRKPELLEALYQLGDDAFAPYVQHDALQSGWVRKWRDIAVHYLHWELDRRQRWGHVQSEIMATQAVGQVTFRGRADRLESVSPQQPIASVVDYKTGASLPKNEAIAAGENVQLQHYALMYEGIESATFVQLCDNNKLPAHGLDGEALQQAKVHTAERLNQLVGAMQAGEPLPAWRSSSCNYCDMKGLCREQVWPAQEDDA